MKRVVVTGMGTINPLGDSIDTFWNNILRGENHDSAHFSFLGLSSIWLQE